MDELVGQSIRGYELQEQVGEGGFGAVFRAVQTVVDREVAIKIILPNFANQPEFIRRFEAEAQLVARLEHPHIVPLYDYWRDPTGAYLVMRYLRGGTLRTALEKGPYSLRATARLVNQIASALMIAHRNNIVHRDVKPSNILLDEDGNAYLSDFGIATNNFSGSNSASQSGRVSGSAGYISPEQINLQPVSPRSDMYAMGIILYEMLTGTHPFAGAKSAVALFIKHANEPLPPMIGIPEPLQAVVFKAAAKNPEERFADMLEMANAFRAAVQSVGQDIGLQQANQLDEFDSSFELTPPTPTLSAVNPYKGLRAFQESDANDFFGREALTKLLIERLDDDHELYRFLAVVGPSGSGKSSVVKAGVIPALRKGAIHNSENWFIVEMVPGVSPFEELAQAISSIATSTLPDLKSYAANPNNGGLNALLKKILPTWNSELLLVVDQFEEIFTQCEEEERTLFLNTLQEAITAPDSRLRVIITLRADFYDRPLMVPSFSQLMQQRTEVVIPLTVDELERAITSPARQVKVFFQQGLAATIVSEVNEQPGVLPMLQYALTELFERRDGSLMTTKAYQEIGGVLGALARRAEEIYTQLDPERQEMARQLFLRLVTLGEGTEDTRRRALQSELYAASGNPKLMEEVINTFGNYRLLTYDRDPITRTPTVEVAHEALIREWKRLREWLDNSRADIRTQRLLDNAVREWEENRRDVSYLLRGGRLEQFEEWLKTTTVNVSPHERAYIEASRQKRELEEKAEAERVAREQAQIARNRRQARIIIAGLTAGMAILIPLAFISFQLSISANQSAVEAIAARETAVLAQNEALQQAATATVAQGEALQQAATATVAQGEALQQAATATIAQGEAIAQAATATIAQGEAIFQAATATFALAEAQSQANANATAQAIALAQANIAATAQSQALREAQASQSLALAAYASQFVNTNSALALALALEANSIPNPSPQVQRVLLSVVYTAPRSFMDNRVGINRILYDSQRELIYTANTNGTISIWELGGDAPIQILTGHRGAIRDMVTSPDGRFLATGSFDQTAILWNLDTREAIFTLSGHNGAVNAVAFSPRSNQLATGSTDASVILWNVATGERQRTLTSDSRNAVNSLDYSPDGRLLLVISDDAMRLWNFGISAFQEFNNSPSRVRYGKFNADGSQIVISGNVQTGTPQIWDTQRRSFIRNLPGHTAPVNVVRFSPDGGSVLSASDDFTLIQSDASTGNEIRRYTTHSNRVTDAAFSANGVFIFSASSDGEIYQWDVVQSSERREFINQNVNVTSLSATMFSPQGRFIITALDNGTVSKWDLTTDSSERTVIINRPPVPQTRLVLSPLATDDALLAAWGSTELRYVNLTTGETLRRMTTNQPRSFIESLSFSPDGRFVVWGGGFFFRERLPDFTRASLLMLWDVETGELVQTFAAHNVFDEAGRLVEGLNRAVTATAFTPDGRYLISGAEDGTIYIWSVDTGQIVRELTGHADRINHIAVSSDGKRVLTGSADRAAILWDFDTGQLFRRFTGHTGAVNSVAFNTNGTEILTGSTDGRMIIWDVDSGQSQQQFISSDSPIVSVAFSPSGKQVLSGSLDGRTTLWEVESALQIAEWARANRYVPAFTCTQRVQFGLPQCDADGNPPIANHEVSPSG